MFLLAVAVLAGCGGDAPEPVAVRRLAGPGFVFSAPAAWKVARTERSVAVRPRGEGQDLVSVTVFRLSRPFRPASWPAAVRELDRASSALATRLRGRVLIKRTATVLGRRYRRYTIGYEAGGAKLEQRLSFLLRGRREYQLLCRLTAPPSEESGEACGLLSESFRPA